MDTQVNESMYRIVVLAFPLLIIGSLSVSGQLDSITVGTVSGTIIDDSLEYTIPSVHLWNESSRMGSVSNTDGEFRIAARNQDTIVFSAIGYYSQVIRASSILNEGVVIRLKQKKYEIDELVVKRFRSYESFIHQVVHHDLPESEISETKEQLDLTLTLAAVESDRERATKDKLETGRFGIITPLGKGIDRQKAFRNKTLRLEEKRRVIESKFNRNMVGDITKLEGEELTEFIALCNFSEDYLYKTDLATIIEDMYALLDDYQSSRDTITSDNL